VLALLFFISGVALFNCPFLNQTNSHAPCCPREASSEQSKCPLSKSLDTCPLYVTEAKIGWTQGAVGVETAAIIAPAHALTPPGSLSETPSTWVPQLTNLHLRLRVLRI
jgi:hypothetical protein